MKTIQNSILFVSVIYVLFTLSVLTSCDKPVTPDIPESVRVTALMNSGTWKINTVTIDGIANNSFAAMTLSFTKTAFTTTNGGVVWPGSGTWSFTNDTAKLFQRDDGVDVTIEAISETSMTLSLTWSKTTLGGGRENSTSGQYVLTFQK